MKNIRIIGALAVIALFFISATGFTQRMHAARYYYNTAAVVTVSGEITSVDIAARGWGSGAGMHLVIKTEKGPLIVYVGPTSFLRDKISLAKGDRVQVTGARTNVDGRSGIVAREIEKGSVKVVLRNDDGTPLWAGQGMGHRR